MIFLTLLALIVTAPPDTVCLAELQQAAASNDPRLRQIELHESIRALEVANLGTQHLPDLSLAGQATYQSEVPSFPGGGAGLQTAPLSKDRYQLTLDVNQIVYDGGAVARQAEVEAANLSVQQQTVRVDLYALREQVNESYFAVLLADAQLASLAILEQDVQARLRAVEAGIKAGAILPGVADELRTELLTMVQQRGELRAGRRAAVDVLSVLTDRDLDESVLILPDPPAPVSDTLPEQRPEFELFERRREQLDTRRALAGLKLRPQLGAFAQAGYGRPGFDFLDNSLHPFWQGGIRVRWTFWDWGTVRRNREQFALQEQIIDTQEQAFTKSLRAAVQRDLQEIRRLQAALITDDDLIAARERIAARAARQLELGVITAADYLEKRNAAVQARLAKEMHRIEWSRVRIHYLTLFGEVSYE